MFSGRLSTHRETYPVEAFCEVGLLYHKMPVPTPKRWSLGYFIDSKKCLKFSKLGGQVGTRDGSRDLRACGAHPATLDMHHGRGLFQGFERTPIGPREPCLRLQADDLAKQSLAPRFIEMSGDLIEQQDRNLAIPALRQQLGMGQHEADQ